MGKMVRVKLFGFQNRGVLVESQATEGAVVGRDLLWPDGTRVVEDDIRNVPASNPTGGNTTGGGSTPSSLLWSLIIGIPALVVSLASLATNGLIARTSSDTLTSRSIQGETNRIGVANGNGVAGNPTVTLGPYPTVKNSVENGDVATIPAGHQMLVFDEFIFDDGEVVMEGELVIL